MTEIEAIRADIEKLQRLVDNLISGGGYPLPPEKQTIPLSHGVALLNALDAANEAHQSCIKTADHLRELLRNAEAERDEARHNAAHAIGENERLQKDNDRLRAVLRGVIDLCEAVNGPEVIVAYIKAGRC